MGDTGALCSESRRFVGPADMGVNGAWSGSRVLGGRGSAGMEGMGGNGGGGA